MKFARLVASLLGSRAGLNSNFYCTKAMPIRRDTTPLAASITELFSRISPFGDPDFSIVPILDHWVKEGRFVDKPSLIDTMKKLQRHKRFTHALEISLWMTDKRYFELTPADAAFRLYLISKVTGVEEAERYFNNLSQKLKCFPLYDALLNCYANAQCVEKAEAVMQKIRSLGDPDCSWSYSCMLNLYRKTRNMEKFDALLQEMKEKGMDRTRDALEIQLSAYADVKDIERMDKVVRLLECDPKVAPRWTTYSSAAAAYTKARLFDKALLMLKKAEAVATGNEFNVYNFLIAQYGTIGRKDEVLRLWSLYKKKWKVVYNKGYQSVLSTLVKLGDFEMAEEIFQEWESQGLTYDISIPNIMISAYSNRGLIEKAEALLNKAISMGGKPNAWTWYHLVEGYLQSEQPDKAVEMMKKVSADSVTRQKPAPKMASIKACLEYLKGVGDTQHTEEFVKLLVDGNVISLRDCLLMKMSTVVRFSMNSGCKSS